jgi:protein-tyrosine phosphatase
MARLCRLLLEHRLVHFLASDSHGVCSRRPLLAQAVTAATEILGEGDARRLVHDHPSFVVSGSPLTRTDYAPISLPRKKRSWFKFW